MLRHHRFALALLLALVFGCAGGAQATSFNLGQVTGPGSFTTGNDKAAGPFTDTSHVTIAAGVSLIFKADIVNRVWRHGAIDDLDGTLSDASGVISDGDATTVYPSSYPYPSRLVTFTGTVLGPGHYYISLFGNSWLDVNSVNSYTANIQFAQTPLPGALLFMLTALAGFGLLGRRRSGRSAAPAA